METLKAIARGENTWTQIKNRLEVAEGRPASKSILHNILVKLQQHNIIEKKVEKRNIEYRIIDPILEYALKKN